jgi:hypothetical protein
MSELQKKDCTRVQFRTPRVGRYATLRDLPKGIGGVPSYTETMNAARFTLMALACSVPLLASAQWQWLEKDGRKVFSDRPPPSDIAPNRIVKQPGMRATPVEATAAAAATATPGSDAAAGGLAVPKVSGTDAALEQKRKLAEAIEADKKRTQESQVASARAENCSRARAGKATLDSGVRMVRANEKGEREILDDKQREAEAKRLDDAIARDCRQ